jgi:hypothetical protein
VTGADYVSGHVRSTANAARSTRGRPVVSHPDPDAFTCHPYVEQPVLAVQEAASAYPVTRWARSRIALTETLDAVC